MQYLTARITFALIMYKIGMLSGLQNRLSKYWLREVKKKYIILTVLITSMSGCSSIVLKLLGVKEVKKLDKEKCEKRIQKIDFQDIPFSQYYLDTTAFYCYWELPISKRNKKDFSQPVQILYFEGDSIVSFHTGCYTKGGLANTHWNVDHRFDQFPPISAIPLDSTHASLKNISTCFVPKQNPKSKFTVYIFWTSMVNKASKRAIKTVVSNIKQFSKTKEITIYLINNDQFYSTVDIG